MRIDIRDVFNEEKKSFKELIEGKKSQEEEPASVEPEIVEELPEAEPEVAEELPEAEPEVVEEPEEEIAEESEIELESESEPELYEVSEENEPELCGAKSKLGFWKLYGSLVVIGAAMVLLLVGLFAYTNVVPREVHITVDGKADRVITKEYTVAAFLESQGIEHFEEDYLSTPTTGFIHDGMKLEVIHATPFSVTADGETVECRALGKTIGEALEDAGYKLGKHDIITPAAETPLAKNMKIVVQRVIIKKETVEEKVEFKTVNKDDTTMNEGETKVLTEGKNGKDKVVYEVTYIDGKESARKELSRETIEKTVDKEVAIGTRINYNGKTYSRKLTVKAYSYTGGGTTASGTRARVGEIAVDPSVIPLGTNVYIEGVGARRAEDTGGNIKGNTIDIYMDTREECIQWGVRYVTIYIE